MNKTLSIIRKQKLQEFPILYLEEEETLPNEKSLTSSDISSHSLNNSLKQLVMIHDEKVLNGCNTTNNKVANESTTTIKNKVASRSTNQLQENGSSGELSSNFYSYKYPLMSVSSHSFNKNLSLGKSYINSIRINHD